MNNTGFIDMEIESGAEQKATAECLPYQCHYQHVRGGQPNHRRAATAKASRVAITELFDQALPEQQHWPGLFNHNFFQTPEDVSSG